MSYESPISILVNEDGNIVARSGSQVMASEQPGLPVMGKDGSGNAQFLKINASGELEVAATVDVDLKAYADGGTDSVTAYGDLAELRQEGASGAERLMVSGAVDLSGIGFESLLTAVGGVESAVNSADSSVQAVSSAINDLKLSVDSVNTSVGDVNSSVQAVSGAIDNLGLSVFDVKTAVESVDSSVQAVSGAIDSLGGGLSLVDINTSVGDVNSSVQAVSGALAELINNTLVGSATVSSMVAAEGSDSVAPLDSRKGFIFFMEGNNTAYVKFGAGATSSDYSITIVGPGGFYELSSLRYTGELSVAFKTAIGVLRITELT
jgi:hypothetical protein